MAAFLMMVSTANFLVEQEGECKVEGYFMANCG